MIDKLKLLFLAILGTIIGFGFAKLLVPEISFYRYFAIEAVITLLHTIYERTKVRL
jgi:hypothetical protein